LNNDSSEIPNEHAKFDELGSQNTPNPEVETQSLSIQKMTGKRTLR